MRKLLALMVAMVMVLGLAGFALAFEIHHPAKKDLDGQVSKDGKSIGKIYVNDWISEGDTSDAYEATIGVTDPTADRAINFPDASGTVALTESIATSMALTDAKALIGNSGGVAVEKTISLTGDVTGSLANSGGIATTLAANAVGANELYRIVNTLVIASAASSNAVGNNALYNANGYTLTARNNANGNQFIANSTMDVNGNVTVFLNGTADVDYTVEIVRWAP